MSVVGGSRRHVVAAGVVLAGLLLLSLAGVFVSIRLSPAKAGLEAPTGLSGLAVDAADGSLVSAGGGALFRTTDQGRSWQQPEARGDLPSPPHDDSGHTWRHSDGQLAEIIRGGMRDPFNKTPELTMPPFEDHLSNQDVADVIAFFKSLWSDERRRFQEEQN